MTTNILRAPSSAPNHSISNPVNAIDRVTILAEQLRLAMVEARPAAGHPWQIVIRTDEPDDFTLSRVR